MSDAITEDDLVAIRRIFSAYEERFEDWYVESRATGTANAETLRTWARKFSIDHIDEDGDATFSTGGWDDQKRIYMPFSAILGTTDEMVERLRAERQERERLERERREQHRREQAEKKQREAEAAERARLRERERIFREECAARGIKVPT